MYYVANVLNLRLRLARIRMMATLLRTCGRIAVSMDICDPSGAIQLKVNKRPLTLSDRPKADCPVSTQTSPLSGLPV